MMATDVPLAYQQFDRRPTTPTPTSADITSAGIAGINLTAGIITTTSKVMAAANGTVANTAAPFIVRYGRGSYDIADFVHKHPGGRNTLAGLQGRRMEQRLRTAPPHSVAAMYLLREYRIDRDGHSGGGIADDDDGDDDVLRDDGKAVDENNNGVEERLPASSSSSSGDEWHSEEQTDESLEVG